MNNNIGLVLVDLQVGAFDGKIIPSLALGDLLLLNISKILSLFRKLENSIFFIQDHGIVGGAFEPGTPGFEIHPIIAPLENEIVVAKNSSNAFSEPFLINLLNEQQINELFFVGLHSEHCFSRSVLGAFEFVRKVSVISDGHGTIDSNEHRAFEIVEKQNKFFEKNGVRLINTDELIKGMRC